MKMKDSHLVLCFFLFAVLVTTDCEAVRPYQPIHPDPVLESWRWRSFPELKGVGLQCLTEDKNGHMWFGTDEGVWCYDGTNWTLYTPEDGLWGTPVTVLYAAQDESIYSGTRRGISRFSGNRWRRIFPPEGDLEWLISDLMEATDGSLWAGTEWGALRYSGGIWTLYSPAKIGTILREQVPSMHLSVVPDRAVPSWHWPEGIGVKVARMTEGAAFVVDLAAGSPGAEAGLQVGDRIVAVDGQSEMIANRLDGAEGTSIRLSVQRAEHSAPIDITIFRKKLADSFRSFPVYDVYEDKDGVMWFGLDSVELLRFDRREEGDAAWRLFTESDGLDTGFGPRTIQTRDGTLWTVSIANRGGVNRFDGQSWSNFVLSGLGGHDQNASVLETRDRTLWVGGNGSLHAFRDGVWSIYKVPEVPLPAGIIHLLEASDGALWFAGLRQDISRLDYGTSLWTAYEGLHFQCETPDGSTWFLSLEGGVVRYDGKGWRYYGKEDGLMEVPKVLITTRKGELWAAGQHDSTAATARFDNGNWLLQTHPRLSWSIGNSAVFESREGVLWFGSVYPAKSERGQIGGILSFDGTWKHYTPSSAPSDAHLIGQSADGLLWFAHYRTLIGYDGSTWTPIVEPRSLATYWSRAMYTSPQEDLWVGHETHGVFHYDGKTWTRYDIRNGLADNSVSSILQTDDGSVWVGTAKGISRFDGQTWRTHALPPDFKYVYPSLRQSRDGALWINTRDRTIRYEFDYER